MMDRNTILEECLSWVFGQRYYKWRQCVEAYCEASGCNYRLLERGDREYLEFY